MNLDQPRTGSPSVQVRDAGHAYGRREVFRDINIDLRAGEIYGLLGPNGAGKTTLMKAMAGHLRLAQGSVRVADRDPSSDRLAKHAISYIPQDVALFPYLTVTENLEVFGRLAGVPRDTLKTEVADMIENAALGDYADSLCRTLSGGYQRRVNICAGLLSKPLAIVLDEPTVGIDVDAREAIHGLLRTLRDAGTAILIATHDLDQAQQLSDRVGMMKNGRITREGNPAELLNLHFGSFQEIVVVLAAPPSASEGATLRKFGLKQTQSSLTWFGFTRPERADVFAMRSELSARGLSVREIRVRTPDLNSLFFDVLGEVDNGQ
jgi:ABC-2 type transport system ATP-binding protein